MSVLAIAAPVPLPPSDPRPGANEPSDQDDPIGWVRRQLKWERRLERLRFASLEGTVEADPPPDPQA